MHMHGDKGLSGLGKRGLVDQSRRLRLEWVVLTKYLRLPKPMT